MKGIRSSFIVLLTHSPGVAFIVGQQAGYTLGSEEKSTAVLSLNNEKSYSNVVAS